MSRSINAGAARQPAPEVRRNSCRELPGSSLAVPPAAQANLLLRNGKFLKGEFFKGSGGVPGTYIPGHQASLLGRLVEIVVNTIN